MPQILKKRISVQEPLFTLEPQTHLKGEFHNIPPSQLKSKTPKLFYSHPNGEIWVGDAVGWLKKLETASVDLIFADPPYNIKKAEWDTFESQQKYLKWSLQWIEELIRKFILASSNQNDMIVDPFLGSGTTAVAAEQLKRKWRGCDNNPQYCGWAANRIELVQNWSIEQWIKFDAENEKRRKSIR